MDVISPDQVRCPTCRALQEWSDSCRRCRCDLRLLRAACSAHQITAAVAFSNSTPASRTSPWATLCAVTNCLPGADSLRLLALCALAREEWETALELAQTADR